MGLIQRILLAVFCVVIGASNTVDAQPVDEVESPAIADFYIGAFAGFAAINHNATIRAMDFNSQYDLPEAATITSGTGTGIQAGLLFELPLSRAVSLGLRAGYQSRGGTLSQNYTNTDDATNQDQVSVEARMHDDLTADIGYLQAFPNLKVIPSSLPLYFIAGPTVLYAMSTDHTYTESIVEPTGATFSRGGRSRTISRGKLKPSTIVPAINVGVGYDFALSSDVGLLLELQYSSTLSDIVTNLTGNGEWKTSTLGATVGIRFGLFGEKERPIVARPIPVDTNRDGHIRAAALVNGELSQDLTITGRKVKATEAYAFLPYVFFAQDSASIPERYLRIDRRAMRDFNFGRIERGDALQVYYHMLNIIGQRLRDNRKARITLTGCSSNAEGADTVLGRRRAQAVADYLQDVWRVAKARIEIAPRGLPANPSLSGVEPRESDRENQRVEFASTDYAILAPVQLPDTSLLSPAGIVRFFAPPVDTSSADSWSLNVMIGDSLIENVETGYGPPPEHIDFEIKTSTDLAFTRPTAISGRLVFRDTMFQERKTFVSDTVVMRQEGAIETERNVVAGSFVDTYTLLLYSFDSDALLDFTQQATILMSSEITDRSKVSIVGHTDRIGLGYYNQELSERRAQVASQNLGVPLQVKEIKGLGEKKLLYDNALPEGRYYCRTVTVTIETPTDTTVSNRPEPNP